MAALLEKREHPPAPASQARRSERVDVRLTVEEKLLLDEAARSRGFKGFGDFVRPTALASLR